MTTLKLIKNKIKELPLEDECNLSRMHVSFNPSGTTTLVLSVNKIQHCIEFDQPEFQKMLNTVLTGSRYTSSYEVHMPNFALLISQSNLGEPYRDVMTVTYSELSEKGEEITYLYGSTLLNEFKQLTLA